MRNKHLEMRRRIEDTKLAITDAELFGSRLYGAVLSDVAEATTHRYRRKCRVLTYWDESPDAGVASTNNRTIKINAANRLTASFPTRKLKDLSLRGLLGMKSGISCTLISICFPFIMPGCCRRILSFHPKRAERRGRGLTCRASAAAGLP